MEEIVRFGGYRFDPRSGQLWSAVQEIRLTPKASAVLRALVARAGRPVSKEELFEIVWSGTAVGDDALTSCVQELRKAFGDDPKKPQFIETRHRRGYRFIAGISSAPPDGVDAPDPPAPASGITTIAVLPFADMSAARDQDYLCEGLAEELINALTHVDGLRVAARTASFQFRDVGAGVRTIGEQLGVESLLEGSVRKAGDRLRVTVQLIEVRTGFHRWSQRFERAFGDVFAIQDEIAEAVATTLRGGALSGREKEGLRRPHTGPAAFEYYLRGRQHLPRMTQADLALSADMFKQAIELDPSYAPAFAGLATVHATLFEWFGAQDEDLAGAERASQRALELAPGLAEAHVARGCALGLSREYEAAATEFEAASALNPNLFDAYYYFARTSFARGDIARSADLFRLAATARQEDFQSPLLGSQSLRILGRDAEAREIRKEGLRRVERALALNPVDARALSLGSLDLFEDGQVERALEWSGRSLALYPDDLGTLVNAACLHARLGHKEESLTILERVFSRGWGKRDWVEHDPDYDLLRDDPRFQRLLNRLK